MRRTPYDGKPYYCTICDAGFGEFTACDDYYCELESEDAAKDRRTKRNAQATDAARVVLKPGDRIRATRCCQKPATYTFAGWDGNWIVTQSGIDDIPATQVTHVNGKEVDFAASGHRA
ncbi:MAG: hypothetical protein AAGL24_09855 [Pseudomonadota bacterium]